VGGGFFSRSPPPPPIFLMFLHLRVDCLIIENLETLESDRNCSISVHFSRSLVILPRFDKKTELLSLDTGQFDVAVRRETCSSRYPVRTCVTGCKLGRNLAWKCVASALQVVQRICRRRLSDVNSTLHKVKIETPRSVRVT